MQGSFFSYNAGQLLTSTGAWSATSGSVFRVYCPRFPQPNHEEGYCTDFDFYRNGDWATKGIYSYAANDNAGYYTGETPDTGNMAGYGNNATSDLPDPTGQYYLDAVATRGGQGNNGWPSGQDINDVYNDMPTYTAAHYDSTGSRNYFGPGTGSHGIVSLADVTGATTDFLWLKPYYLFTYDRGDTGTASFKRRWFMSTGTPTISGTTVSWSSALNKTSNYLHVLLQPNANIATYPVYPFALGQASHDYAPNERILIDANSINTGAETYTATNCVDQYGTSGTCPVNRANYINGMGVTGGVSCGSLTEVSTQTTPASCQYSVKQDATYSFYAADLSAGVTIHYTYSTSAASMRSLNVIEAQNYGTAATGATLVQSSSGQGFDCAHVSTSLGCFMRNLATFTGTTFGASGATTVYVSNLAPGNIYNVSGAGTPATVTADNSGTATFAATGTGNITVGAYLPPSITAVSGGVLSGILIQ
jgi:hypothetical protein